MSKYFSTSQIRAQQNTGISQRLFHKKAISEVKKRLGSNCSFLSHLLTEGKLKFLAKIKIGGKSQTIRVDSGLLVAEELQATNYKDLKNLLSDYVTGKRAI